MVNTHAFFIPQSANFDSQLESEDSESVVENIQSLLWDEDGNKFLNAVNDFLNDGGNPNLAFSFIQIGDTVLERVIKLLIA